MPLPATGPLLDPRRGLAARAGDRVFLVLQSANRDKGTFADPDRFDIERPAKPLRTATGLRISYE